MSSASSGVCVRYLRRSRQSEREIYRVRQHREPLHRRDGVREPVILLSGDYHSLHRLMLDRDVGPYPAHVAGGLPNDAIRRPTAFQLDNDERVGPGVATLLLAVLA